MTGWGIPTRRISAWLILSRRIPRPFTEVTFSPELWNCYACSHFPTYALFLRSKCSDRASFYVDGSISQLYRITPCRLSVTAFYTYSQIPSVPGVVFGIRILNTRHAVVTRYPFNMIIFNIHVCIILLQSCRFSV
jgi:hypothetical protein